METLQQKATDIWSQLAPWQRFAGIATILSLIGLFVVMGLWMQDPNYSVLYRDLSERDAAAIVNELEAQNIPYELSTDGKTVSVPQSAVAAARLQLASQNLPQGGTIGYEMFDGGALSSLGMTEFMQRVNFQRALEGELSRTIAAVESVDEARVHIVLPEESLFAEQQQQPKASVVLKTMPGSALQTDEVQSIRFLVASSVEGLDAENITIVDVTGKMYDSPDADGDMTTAMATNGQLDVQRRFEQATQNDLQAMLDRTLGPNRTVVQVNVDMNWDQEEAQVELYAPAGEVGSVIRSSSREEETWTGTGEGAAGVPGVDPNAPDDVPTYQMENGGTGEYNRSSDTINYEVSKEIRNTVKQPGSVERLTVAVLMDEELPEEQVETVQALVEAAAGVDTERGDVVQVQRIPFNDDFYAEEAARMEAMQRQELYMRIGIIVAVLLGLGLILFFTRKIFNDMQKRMMPYVVDDDTPVLPPGPEENPQKVLETLQKRNAASAYKRSNDPYSAFGDEYDFEDFLNLPPPDESELRLRAIARHNPEVVATILEDWADSNGSAAGGTRQTADA